MMWAALCDRPSPALIKASPAAARGTRKMKKRQATVAISVSPGVAMGIILFPLAESHGTGRQGPVPKLPRRCRRRQTRRAKAARPRSTIAASTRNHPASNSKKLTNFIPKAPVPERQNSHRHSRCRLKYHNRARTNRIVAPKLRHFMADAVSNVHSPPADGSKSDPTTSLLNSYATDRRTNV